MKTGLREIVFMVMLLGIPVGAWWFVFRPANEHQADMCKQIEAKQEKLRHLNELTGKVGDLEKEIASLERSIKFFESKLPAEKEIDKVLHQTWRLAEENHLVTKSIRSGKATENAAGLYATGEQAIQPIVIQLEGKFEGFYNFLQALERQPRIMRIGLMNIKKPETGPEGTVQVSFRMSVFFERDQNQKSEGT